MCDALAEIAHYPQHAVLRKALLLDDVTLSDESAHAIVMRYEHEADALGYPMLA